MKRLLTVLLLLMCLVGCAKGTVSCFAGDDLTFSDKNSGTSTTICWSQPPASSWTVNDDINVSLSQDTFPVGCENFTVTFTNTGTQTMLYGESYMFQYNDGSGWKDLETIENYGFNSIAYLLFPGATQTLEVGPWMLTEPLSEGRYRIVGCDLWVADREDQLSYGGDYTEYNPYVLEFDITAGAGGAIDGD